MVNPLKGRTNSPNPERHKGIPEVEMPDCWKDFFKTKENNQCGVTIEVREPMVIYCTDVAKRD